MGFLEFRVMTFNVVVISFICFERLRCSRFELWNVLSVKYVSDFEDLVGGKGCNYFINDVFNIDYTLK